MITNGYQKKIIEATKIHKTTVSNYFTGKYVSKKKQFIILKCIEDLGLETDIEEEKKRVPEYVYTYFENRKDIINNLEIGDQKIISEKLNTTKVYVNKILTGKCNQNTPKGIEIIKEAELLAAINVWKNRFCKFKSLL